MIFFKEKFFEARIFSGGHAPLSSLMGAQCTCSTFVLFHADGQVGD